MRILYFLLPLLLLPGFLLCQVPTQTSMQIFLSENSVPLQGTRQLTVRWYSTAVGGFPENTEVLQAQFTDGYASIVLGTTDPVSDTMLMRGTVWVGLQLDSDPEYSPRTMVLSTPFARIAQRAIEAQSLSKEVTGVVTSVNEIAGNVILVGGVGIAVARRGPIITISSTDLVETGEVFGTDTDFEFVIIPKTKISSSSCVTVNVSSATTSISATIVNIDPINNVVRIRTAAPLLRDESVRWSVHR